jgi:hypothetical protein
MTNFNFSVTAGSPPNQNIETPMWSFNGVRMLAGPAGSVVLHRTRGDRRLIVQPDVAEALRLCAPFRSIQSHTRNIVEAIPDLKEHTAHTTQTLQNLADAGLFESSEDCWRRLTASNLPSDSNMAARIFVLTCDRPAALNRLLSGLREYPLPKAVEGIWIIDDSRQAEHLRENAAIINLQAEGAAVPVVHVDVSKREDLIQHLKRALPEQAESIDWLIDRSHWGRRIATYGQARNVALLLSVGKRALVLDDDIVPQAIAPPRSGATLRFRTPNEREAMFYPSKAALMQHALPLAESPLAMMLDSLGQPLAKLLTRHLSGHQALSGFDGELLDRHSGESRVLLGQCGSWGDVGTSDGTWIFNLPKASIKRLLDSDVPLIQQLSTAAQWMGYRGPVLTQYGTLSQMTGIDHRALLPPYIPAGRGEDVLFGILLQRLHPDSAVWNESWAIRHEPMEDRADRGALTPLSVTPGTALLADWLGREPQDQWGLSAEQRLRGIAEQVQRLAVMDAEPLESLIRQELVSKRSTLLNRCMEHLTQVEAISDLPGAADWQQFLERSRDQLVTEIQTPESQPLNDRLTASSLPSLEALRAHSQQFANALSGWSEICEAAKNHPF